MLFFMQMVGLVLFANACLFPYLVLDDHLTLKRDLGSGVAGIKKGGTVQKGGNLH